MKLKDLNRLENALFKSLKIAQKIGHPKAGEIGDLWRSVDLEGPAADRQKRMEALRIQLNRPPCSATS